MSFSLTAVQRALNTTSVVHLLDNQGTRQRGAIIAMQRRFSTSNSVKMLPYWLFPAPVLRFITPAYRHVLLKLGSRANYAP